MEHGNPTRKKRDDSGTHLIERSPPAGPRGSNEIAMQRACTAEAFVQRLTILEKELAATMRWGKS